jgi:hypothetical protein
MRELGRLAWRAVRLEVTLYAALVRWTVRRPSVPEGTSPVGYARLVAPMMGLWIFASAAEIPLVHLLVPWEPARLALLVVSVWGLLWMVGLYAALRMYPHLVDDQGVRVRYATIVDIPLRWNQVREVRVEERELPSSVRIVQRTATGAGTELHVAVGARTNVTAVLREQTQVRTAKGAERIGTLSLWVDEPRAFVARARDAISAASTA